MSRAVLLPALAAALLLGAGLATAAAPPAGGLVVVLQVRGPLVPVTADLLERAVDRAAQRQAPLLLLELDTPGGLVDTVRRMVSDILESPVPVAVYVQPAGASAASGGAFLVLAADVAGMAPVSDLGAAHPVFAGSESRADDVLLTKAANEMAALARSLAETRGRPVDLAEALVRESQSWTAREALERGLVDTVAEDRDAFLAWLNGRAVRRPDGRTVTLELAGVPVEELRLSLRERLLLVLSHPLVAFFLLALGVVGIYVEITHPGALLPAAVGLTCLLLFALASQVLPVNWVGVGLVGLGLGLLLLELKVVSYGALTVGGLACLVIGSLTLFNTPPALRLPRTLVVGVMLGVGLIAVFLVRLVIRAQGQPPATGREALVGLRGEALTDCDPAGKVLVRGEYYDADAEGSVRRGEPVVVVALDGRRLRVRAATAGGREVS